MRRSKHTRRKVNETRGVVCIRVRVYAWVGVHNWVWTGRMNKTASSFWAVKGKEGTSKSTKWNFLIESSTWSREFGVLMDLAAFPEPRSSTVDSSSHNRNWPSQVDNETHLSKVRILRDKWAYQLPPKLEGAPHVIHRIWQSANPAAGEGHEEMRKLRQTIVEWIMEKIRVLIRPQCYSRGGAKRSPEWNKQRAFPVFALSLSVNKLVAKL